MVEKLLRYLADNEQGLAVEAKDGSILGIATARGVVKALASGSSDEPNTTPKIAQA